MLIKLQWLFFFLLGLAPVKYTNTLRNNRRNGLGGIEFSSSKISVFYSLFLIIHTVLTSYFCHPFSITDCDCNKNDTKLINVTEVIISLIANIAVIVLLFLFIIQRDFIIEVAYQLVNIDVVMNTFRQIFKLGSIKRKVLVVLYINSLLSMAVIITEIFLSIEFNTVACLYLFHGIVFNYFATQYTITLMLIERRFRSCNDALLNLRKTTTSSIKIINSRENSLDETCIKEIIGLKRYHTILCKLCTKLADFYSFGILCIILYDIVCMVVSIHNIITPLTLSHTKISVARDLNDLFWMLSKMFPLFTVAAYATQIQVEIKKTGNIVQKMLLECSMSLEIRKELKIFSLELLHRNFQFTAYNIIPVDCTILRTVFGAVATYLIIFIQFQVDDEGK